MPLELIIIIIAVLIVSIPSIIFSIQYIRYNFLKKRVRKLEEFEKVGFKVNRLINRSQLNSKERLFLIIYILQDFAEEEDDLRSKDISKLVELKANGQELLLGEQLYILADELKALVEINYK